MRNSNWITSTLAALALSTAMPAALADEATTEVATTPAVEGTVLGDVVLGSEDAPITIIEYASITCPHCAHFHEEIMPVIQERIDQGQVKFIFRDFPTPPAEIAMAGFALARCSGEDNYYAVLDKFFTNQTEMFDSLRNGTVGTFFTDLAANHGVDEATFDACLSDRLLFESMVDIITAGQEAGVASTPTVFLNGTQLTSETRTAESMAAAIDAALGIEPSSESVDAEISPEEEASVPAE
ncbi:DsbA family protein [Ponticaulis sp.]|uniref:DsbA family protein n=1 Tax=Ponticaulis sp. TaxID=2020902 RepID=UPI0025E9CBA2|nr:DsbA family protein [Ponticaulis sp.]|tara:strand:- start:4818 stop:5537 length:720 start_codon:yes stop_codon:yes gene_type:complete